LGNAVYSHSARLGRSEPDLRELYIVRISKEITNCLPIEKPEQYKSVRFPVSLYDFELSPADQIFAAMPRDILWHA
jgi:hypothetical protein